MTYIRNMHSDPNAQQAYSTWQMSVTYNPETGHYQYRKNDNLANNTGAIFCYRRTVGIVSYARVKPIEGTANYDIEGSTMLVNKQLDDGSVILVAQYVNEDNNHTLRIRSAGKSFELLELGMYDMQSWQQIAERLEGGRRGFTAIACHLAYNPLLGVAV